MASIILSFLFQESSAKASRSCMHCVHAFVFSPGTNFRGYNRISVVGSISSSISTGNKTKTPKQPPQPPPPPPTCFMRHDFVQRQVTEQYVQAALTDLLKVTIDLPAWEASQKKSKPSPPQAASEQQQQQQQQAAVEAVVATDCTTAGTQQATASPASPATTSAPQATPAAAAAENEKKGPTSPSTPGDHRESNREEKSIEGSCGNEKSSEGTTDQKVGGGGRAGADGGEKPPDTGLWRLLYKGAFVPFPVASFGTDLALKGSRIANGKRARTSLHTVKL